MQLIEHLIEPQRLLVIWQHDPRGKESGTGKRYVVGEIRYANGQADLEYYGNQETAGAQQEGFSGMTGQPYEPQKVYRDVLNTLEKRLPPASRADYRDYLYMFRIAPEAADNASVPALLAYTGGRLAGDGFSFAHTFENAGPPFDFTFEIAGFRHCDGMSLTPQELNQATVSLHAEDDNPYDGQAVMVCYDHIKLGYVPNGMATTLRNLLANYSLQAHITRINGTPERPKILVYVMVK